jgi:hypothetical protein
LLSRAKNSTAGASIESVPDGRADRTDRQLWKIRTDSRSQDKGTHPSPLPLREGAL